MKSYKIYFVLLIGAVILSACSEKSSNPIDPPHYPVDMNSTLEYETRLFIQYYDSTGNLFDPETIFTDYALVQVLNSNDTLDNYTNLYSLISFEKNFPANNTRIWYLDSDSGFYAIAYSSTGTFHNVLPKQGGNTVVDYVKSKLQHIESPYFVLKNNSAINDSIYLYEKPVKLFMYPIVVGSRWIEANEFIKIERVVSGYKRIDVAAGNFRCYEIKRIINDPAFINLSSVEYVDLNIGLIKRQIVADSMMIILEPGDTVGYFRFTSVSELIGIK